MPISEHKISAITQHVAEMDARHTRSKFAWRIRDTCLEETLCNVHTAGRLKAIVEAEPGLLRHEVAQLGLEDALLADRADQLVLGLHVVTHGGGNRRLCAPIP